MFLKTRFVNLNLAVAVAAAAFSSQLGAAPEVRELAAPQMSAEQWKSFQEGELQNVRVHFAKGDTLSLAFRAEGDFLEGEIRQPSIVRVKRDLWITFEKGDILASVDGETFKKVNEVLGGSLSVNATSDDQSDAASSLEIGLKVYAK